MMRLLITTLSFVLTTAVASAGDRKAMPVPARVVITGMPTLVVQASNIVVEIKPGQDVQEELAKALKEVRVTVFKPDEATSVVVALPTEGLDSTELGLAAIRKDRLVAVEGILTTTDDKSIMEISGMKGTKRVALLVAKTATWVNEHNKNRFPSENQVTIRGVARKGKIRIGSETLDWAIENGDGFIPIRLAKDATAPDAGATLSVSGSPRAVDGRPFVTATKIHLAGE